MGCKVQSIWHIWTLLLLPFVKLQHFLHSSAGTQSVTSGMFWSYLKFLITFFFIYYIFHIFIFFISNLTLQLFIPSWLQRILKVPKGEPGRCQAPQSCPGGCCRSAGPPQLPWLRKRRQRKGWLSCGGHGEDTSGQLLTGQPCRHFPAASFMAFPRKWCASPRAMKPPSEIQRSDCTALQQPGGIKSSGAVFSFCFFFLNGKEKIRVHAFRKLHQTIT